MASNWSVHWNKTWNILAEILWAILTSFSFDVNLLLNAFNYLFLCCSIHFSFCSVMYLAKKHIFSRISRGAKNEQEGNLESQILASILIGLLLTEQMSQSWKNSLDRKVLTNKTVLHQLYEVPCLKAHSLMHLSPWVPWWVGWTEMIEIEKFCNTVLRNCCLERLHGFFQNLVH